MPGSEIINRLPELPNFAQALVAIRMIRRGVLAKFPEPSAERDLVLNACDAAETCAKEGGGTFRHQALFDQVMALRYEPDGRRGDQPALRAAAWWAIDAINAADNAQDFPIDETVTRSARQAVVALGEDRELNRLQISILLASDIDQLLFACDEAGRLPAKNLAGKYEGLGQHVLSRLAPVHALTVHPYQPTPEERCR